MVSLKLNLAYRVKLGYNYAINSINLSGVPLLAEKYPLNLIVVMRAKGDTLMVLIKHVFLVAVTYFQRK